MVNQVTQSFLPGPRLIDGSDLNTLVAQINGALAIGDSSAAITALTTVGAGTITAAGIVGGVTSRGGAQSATAFTDTTATAAAIISAVGTAFAVNESFFWTYENYTNANATLAGGVGVTVSGNSIVPLLTWAQYLVTKTGAATVTLAFVAAGLIAPLPATQFTTGTNTANATIQVAGIVGAYNVILTLGGATEGTYPLPPAAQITAAIPNAIAGMTYLLTIRNAAAAITATLTGLTGTTITGTATIARSSQRTFNVSVDSLSSVTLSGISTSSL